MTHVLLFFFFCVRFGLSYRKTVITPADISCHICRFFWRWSEIVTIDNVVFLPRTMALAIFKNYYLFIFLFGVRAVQLGQGCAPVVGWRCGSAMLSWGLSPSEILTPLSPRLAL